GSRHPARPRGREFHAPARRKCRRARSACGRAAGSRWGSPGFSRAAARAPLGRPDSMSGRVVRGQQLGRSLGFPTANLRLDRKRSALYGIFAVRVRGIPGLEGAPGVASLGTRPTVGGTVPLLEVYVFDFDGDLYGREIEVEFVAKLREEQRFASVEAMVEQIHRDVADARRILNVST